MHQAHTLLPAMTMPSLIVRLAASGVWKHAIRWVHCCPGARLCMGLIHLVASSESLVRPESLSILLCSDIASGLCDTGTYLTMNSIDHILTTDVLPKALVKVAFSFLTHCAVTLSPSSKTTPPLWSFLALTALGAPGLSVSFIFIMESTSLAFSTSTCSMSSCR